MRPLAKLGLFALVLLGALGAGAAVGEAVGPIDTGDEAPTHDEMTPTTVHDHRDHSF